MVQTAQKTDKPPSTEIPVGEVLRRTRLHYNQTIQNIENALHIRADQIEAIEQGHTDKLPGRVYAIGFVRSYSEYLGLDGDKMVSLFKAQCVGKTESHPGLNFPVSASENKLPPLWLIIFSILLVGGVIWFGASSMIENRDIVESIPDAPRSLQKSLQKAAAPETPPSSADAPVLENNQPYGPQMAADAPPQATEPPEQTITEKPGEGIILNIIQNSWVEIRDQDDKVLLSRVLQAGDQYFVPDRPDLFISIGNAGGLGIEVDGVALRPLGRVGDVLRNLRLDGEALKREFAQTPSGSAPAQKPVENPL
ncbi:MAG: helix-turn-helix domain-containing protein [Alphaproteobacteria bacterium]|nr:helix-turn-helix domain-containing protein [Alphaproteobacteria bacterium]